MYLSDGLISFVYVLGIVTVVAIFWLMVCQVTTYTHALSITKRSPWLVYSFGLKEDVIKSSSSFWRSDSADKIVVLHNQRGDCTSIVVRESHPNFDRLKSLANERRQPFTWIGFKVKTKPRTFAQYFFPTSGDFLELVELVCYPAQSLPDISTYQWAQLYQSAY